LISSICAVVTVYSIVAIGLPSYGAESAGIAIDA